MKKKSLTDFACEIENASALEAEKIGFIPKFVASMSLPTRNLDCNEYSRKNGRYELYLISPSKIGLPYGTYPRIIITWMTTESVIKKTQEIEISNSLSGFIKKLNKKSTGGKNGSITALKEQAKRLFSTSIIVISDNKDSFHIEHCNFIDRAKVLWEPKNIKTGSIIKLSMNFYNEIQESSIPVDLRVIEAFSNHSFALDIYFWMTFRYFILSKNNKNKVHIKWEVLIEQFGNRFNNKNNFISKFKKTIKKVHLLYPYASFAFTKSGIILYKSPPHVSVKPYDI